MTNHYQLAEILPRDEKGSKAGRNRQIRKAHLQYGYPLTQIARHLDLHYTTELELREGTKYGKGLVQPVHGRA